MKFYYFTHSISDYSKYKNSVLLTKDNWDDWFQFETKSYVQYIDQEGNAISLGSVKIGQMNMSEAQRTADIPYCFQQLPGECFSLGQSDYYYAAIGEQGDTFRKEVLVALNDIAYDLDLFKKVKGLSVTRTSLMREISTFTITRQFHRIAHFVHIVVIAAHTDGNNKAPRQNDAVPYFFIYSLFPCNTHSASQPTSKAMTFAREGERVVIFCSRRSACIHSFRKPQPVLQTLFLRYFALQ